MFLPIRYEAINDKDENINFRCERIPLLVSKVTALPLATQSVDEVDVFNSHNLIYNQHLTPTQVRDLVSLMNEFSDCFASTTKHLGKTNLFGDDDTAS